MSLEIGSQSMPVMRPVPKPEEHDGLVPTHRMACRKQVSLNLVRFDNRLGRLGKHGIETSGKLQMTASGHT